MPFSAANMRTTWGLGPIESYSFMVSFPLAARSVWLRV
jgi:hypothetical protein